MIYRIGEGIGSSKRAFAGIPVHCLPSVGLGLVTKTDLHARAQSQFWRGVWS